MKKKENIIIFCSHPDDEVISMGGTLNKYSKEGKKIICIIFSYGELSHLERKVIIKKRIKESKDAGKILGYKNIIFFGLPDGKISSEVENVRGKIKELIKKYKPNKIFTHSPSDPMPDHRAVNKIITELVSELKGSIDLYGFEVWNIVNIKEADMPKLYNDVTKEFKFKVRALKKFKSQRHIMIQLAPLIYTRAKIAGEELGCKYAEKFYKLN